MGISEPRLLSIGKKIFSLDDIKGLATILWQDYEKEKESTTVNPGYLSISYSIKLSDASSFESEDLLLFDKSEILDENNEVTLVTMTYQKRNEKSVKINLEHGFMLIRKEYGNKSSIEVEGSDTFWLDDISNKIELFINSVPNQGEVYFKNKKIFNVTYFLIGILGTVAIIDYTHSDSQNYVPFIVKGLHSYRGAIELIFICGLMGALCWAFLTTLVTSMAYNLWPPIELQIGTEQARVEKKKKWFIVKLVTFIVVFLVLSVILEIRQ